MELTVSQIRYLLAIYRLSHKGIVRSADIAGSLAVTPPSVHRMITQLADIGLLEKEKYSYIRLTAKGWVLSERYHAWFSCICGVLNQNLHLPSDCTEEGAIAILRNLNAEKLSSTCACMEAPCNSS